MQERLTILPRSELSWTTGEVVRDLKNVLWGMCNLLVTYWMITVSVNFYTIFFPFLFVEKLMKAEERGSGDVSWSVYGAYIKAAGGPLFFLITMVLFLSTTGSIAFSNWWLSHWIKQGSGVSSKRDPAYCHLVCILEKLLFGDVWLHNSE